MYWRCTSSPIVAILTGNHVGQGSAVAAAKRWQLSQRLSLPAWAQRQHSQVSLLHLPHRQMPCGVRGRSSRCRAAYRSVSLVSLVDFVVNILAWAGSFATCVI